MLGLWVALGVILAGCGAPSDGAQAPGGMDAPVESAPVELGRGDEAAVEAGDAAGGPDTARPPDDGPAPTPEVGGGDADGGACPTDAAVPDPKQPWVAAYATDILSHLTGEMDVTPGVRLADRGSAATRQQARTYLAAEVQRLGLVPQMHTYGTGTNVFARMDATMATAQTVVVGAHYDTVPRTPGANDNASGVAVVLAVARYLSQVGCRSKHVLFVLFDQEEVGLIGSAAFASKLAADGVPVHSVHSVDQVGWDSNRDRLLELERPDPGLRQLYLQAASELGLSSQIRSTTTGATDHVSFRPRFLAIGITEGYQSGDTTPYRHTPMDRLATIDVDYLTMSENLVAQVLVDLLR